ncbi:hypothetical protein BFP97_11015 [Roseivirga sp. 4D4]|uniref:hypothetical protein n=1 Tax=Roseivirga sp. 4D4 TaxID=1889784 RepID=UPI0008538250|nr:hypothetical protein [Roseivirga sp. 4D4]OEK02018.1 hypothetical protein BFP97_11015 [Roseivirga sp. 4D4]
MPKILHILNGDSTLHQFNKSGIEGDTYVWREVLSDGPVSADFGSELFWAERDQFMSREFQLEPGRYQKECVTLFKEMEGSLPIYDEVVLWFEYDLFCQINMVALIHWLGKQELDNTTSLVCVGKIDDSDRLYGLGEIEASQYAQLFETRLKLGSREFEFCSDVYETYCASDPTDLYNYVLMSLSELPYLPDALDTHFRRYPYKDSGLTEIEQRMIDLIEAGESDQRKLVGKMLRWQKHQGFGDLQYFNILENMKPLFKDFEKLVLHNDLDKSKVEQLLDRNKKLGGAQLSDWYWDKHEKTLIPKESAS